jgi:L-asparaginase II
LRANYFQDRHGFLVEIVYDSISILITLKSRIMKTSNPILVEVTRGDLVESIHRGAVAVIDGAGEMVAKCGDIERSVYARSAIKPLQALPLIETGAADYFNLSENEIALACSSHNAEDVHTNNVDRWLGRVGLSSDDLECGACPPKLDETLRDLYGAGEAPNNLHNNCSGKHAGMLNTALHMGESTKGYIGLIHPVQKRITEALTEMMGSDLSQAPAGIDGCGIPVFGMSLTAIAKGMAKLANPDQHSPARKTGIERISQAMAAHPYMIAGRGRFDTALMQATEGDVLAKGGAEGVQVAFIPRLGLGIALKIDDGGRRGADVAMMAVLKHLGVLDDTNLRSLVKWLEMPLNNWAGTLVGIARSKEGMLI